jgi:raffinose/stachyose/melibiose transport system permease protein
VTRWLARPGDLASAGMVQLVLILNSALMLYPIVIMVFAAFKPTAEIFARPFAPPDFSHIDNFVRIVEEANFLRYLGNSILVTGVSVTLILMLGTMAAYAIARYRFALATPIFLIFLAGLMLPLKLAIIPLFVQMNGLGLIDSRLSLILIYVAMGLPSTVFIMTGFLRTLPGELEDAARIDGASEPRILWSIMLPLCKPPLVIAGIHNAVPVWNDFFFPLIFIQSDARKTLPQGLTTFIGEYATDWGMLFAGLTIAALPITLVYIVLSRQFIAGMTQGVVK